MKKESKYYQDLVKMVPLAMADAKYSDAKCKILAEACMSVMGLLDEYKVKRAAFVEQLNKELEKELIDSAQGAK